MAQPPPIKPITPADQDADLAFRAQMAVYHYVLGYWKQGVAIIGVVLLGAFVVGQTSTHIRDQQRESSAALAEVERTLPEASLLVQYGLIPRFDLADPVAVQKLEAAAEAFEQVARDGHGLARAEAWFRAGDLWDQLGKSERAMPAFEQAYDADRGGIYTYAAGNRLALMHRERGENDAARTILRDLGSDLDGFLAEQALLDLMTMLEDEGDADGVRRIASEFRVRFENSPRLDLVGEVEARLAASKGS